MRSDYQDQVKEAKSIERPAVKRAEKAGWTVIKVGVNGWPDRLFIKGGRYVWMEFKTPWGQRARLQETRIKTLRAQGCEAHFVDSVEWACEILGC